MKMIEIGDVQLVKRCLESYYAACPKVLPVVPSEMRDGDWQQDDWVRWKLVESRITETDVLALEGELPFCLPPLFRAFLVAYYVLDMDFGEFFLPSLPSDDPLKEVRRYLFQPELWEIGYAQFASGDSGDPVCLDLQAPMPNGEFRVVVINHDNVTGSGSWSQRERIEPHAKEIAHSFREFFTGLFSAL